MRMCAKCKHCSVLKLSVSDETVAMTTAEGSLTSPAPDCEDAWDQSLQRTMELQVFRDVEAMEEKVCNASLQVYSLLIVST